MKNTKLNILVIEDHLGDYILIEDYLNEEHLNISLIRAARFSEAKELLIHEHNFDVVLLDLSLPDADNNEDLVTSVVALAPKIPVIVLTGFADKDFGVKTLNLGISDYLLKDDLNAAQLSKSIYYSIERNITTIQLGESEKKYKNLFDSSPLPMWVLDRNSLQFLSVNSAAINLYGYTQEEFLNMTVKDLWAEDEAVRIEKIWKNCIHTFLKTSVKHYTKSGEIIELEIKSNPIEFDGKKARVTLATDITARVLAEKALILSEQRYKALVQEASELVMILNFEGAYTYVSPSSKMILGIEPDLILNSNFFHLIHPEDLASVKEDFLKLEHTKRIQLKSFRVRSKSEEWRWLETILTNLTHDPSVGGIVANSRDITDFVEQENKLIESLLRYNIVAKATSDTVTDYDVQLDKMEYNEGMEKMFGYTQEQVGTKGDWWDDKVHPEDRDKVKFKTQELYLSGASNLQVEYRFQCSDGSYKYILDRSYLVTDDSGKPKRMIGSMQDMTEIYEYINTIKDRNACLKEIAWTQSHVVRAPLARIMAIIDLLQVQGGLGEQSKLLEYIVTSAKELDEIIRKITEKTEQEV
ncbi:PAS domain S-box-containing protein [Gillisia sp. Hel1_33_143]|uniref:PAS domain S-box protein n=1 Tax=Gillisia sp. Hel1_33_143 TaxID=1336796 RepID=UPI00087C2A41|nr:PAS domain S-box protein [Gillisia sp. Hel1_33_143]SDS78658.1 PAS domain S-box-containing protein [Gillisia sp. Hel1_33_143]